MIISPPASARAPEGAYMWTGVRADNSAIVWSRTWFGLRRKLCGAPGMYLSDEGETVHVRMTRLRDG
jgi:hypothetical protein